MEVLNGLIQTISVDFDSNNNSTPVDYSDGFKDYRSDGEADSQSAKPITEKKTEKDITRTVIDLLNAFRAWKKSIEFIESEAKPHHDYKNIKANGFRSMLKINTLAIKRVNKILSQKELSAKHLTKCIALARLLTKINDKTKEFHQRDLEYKQNLANNNQSEKDAKVSGQSNKEPFTSKNLYTSSVALDFFEFYNELESDLVDYYRYHPLFYFRRGLRRMAKALLLFISTSSSLPSSLVFNGKKKSKVIAKLLNSPTLTYPFSIIEQINCSAYNDVFVPLKFIGDGLQTNTVYLPRQHKYRLNDIQTCMSTNRFISIDHNWSYEQLNGGHGKQSKTDKIRVRIVREKSTLKSGTVLFHSHGGAFVFHSPDCHEIYLREFAKSLPEVVIMSVDYRTGAEHPKAQQDVLDAYLWLTSGLDEVEEVLGFQPEKILVCGDSAGAFFNFSLIHLLNDFNVEIQNENLLDQTLRCPDAIFNFYGFYNLTTISPAIMNANLDFFLPPTNMRIAFGSLLHGVEKAKFKKRIFFPAFVDKKKRWYDPVNLREQTSEMIRHFETIPYLSSVHHFDYDAIQVPLYLVTSDLDLCLDHNIDLANRWKGEVNMLVLEDIIHGFLQLEDGDRTIREDILKSINLLRIAVNKL